MIKVHHLENSRSTRVLWLLEELGVEYELVTYKRGPDMRAPAEYKALHPTGKSPLVSDDDQVLAESGAIVEHFLDKYDNGTLRPSAGAPGRDEYLYWMHVAEGSLMAMLTVQFLTAQMDTRAPFFMRPIIKAVTSRVRDGYSQPSLEDLYGMIEDQLGRTQWLAGDHVTGADIMMCYPVQTAAIRGGLDQRFPNTQAYLARIKARPAYQKAEEKGGELNVPT